MKLGDVFDMKAGKYIKASEIATEQDEAHPYPCYGANGLRGYVSAYNHEGAFNLIGRQGALCGNISFADNKFYATEHAVVCTPRNDTSIRWAFYKLTAMDLNQYKTKSAQPGLSVQKLEKVPIAVPPLEEQERIVSILDKFDALVNDLTSGLPAELEARRKQYEYYRDKLLSFQELPADAQRSAS